MNADEEWYPDLQPADERIALEQRLEEYRRVVAGQMSAFGDEAAGSNVLAATPMTPAGILKHLAWVEDRWFQGKLLGEELPEPWRSAPLDDEPDWPFTSAVDDSVESLQALYRDACDRSRGAADGFHSLDAFAAVPSWGVAPVNLRYIYVHMIDETARHAGHLDLMVDAVRASG